MLIQRYKDSPPIAEANASKPDSTSRCKHRLKNGRGKQMGSNQKLPSSSDVGMQSNCHVRHSLPPFCRPFAQPRGRQDRDVMVSRGLVLSLVRGDLKFCSSVFRTSLLFRSQCTRMLFPFISLTRRIIFPMIFGGVS